VDRLLACAQSPATRRLVAGGQRRARFGSPDTTRPARREDARLVSMENVYMSGRPSCRPLTETRDYAAHTKKGKLRGQMATELGFGGGEPRLQRQESIRR
jgi:hypothetical protein